VDDSGVRNLRYASANEVQHRASPAGYAADSIASRHVGKRISLSVSDRYDELFASRIEMKALLLIGVAAGVVSIVGGVVGQHWMIGAGAVVLLVVIIVLPWLRTVESGARSRDG
jgi:hypothetical protein